MASIISGESQTTVLKSSATQRAPQKGPQFAAITPRPILPTPNVTGFSPSRWVVLTRASRNDSAFQLGSPHSTGGSDTPALARISLLYGSTGQLPPDWFGSPSVFSSYMTPSRKSCSG